MLIFILFSSIIITCNGAAPADWQPRIDSGQMVYSPSDATVASNIRASIGNGFFSTVIGSDTMFVAGLFNGASTTDPSHRARIPATAAISVSGSTTTATALDIERATFYRRSQILSGSNVQADIEQRWYAHRQRPNLLIMELQVTPYTSVSLNLANNAGAASTDLALSKKASNPDQQVGPILVPELPNGQIVTLGIVSDSLSPVSVNSNTTYYYISSLATSIETSDPLSAALSEYNKAKSSPSTLWQEHVNAWSQIWSSGIEIGGRLDVAAAVNTSSYYILSSVRDDRVFSLSPGSLSSNGYNGHTFWDCETWMYPSLLFLQPIIAQSLLQYRSERLDESIAKAKSYDPPYDGAMIAWESAFTGAETCPTWAGTGLREQHISGDVAFAARQFWLTSKDITWLKSFFPLLSALADFWVSKAKSGSDGFLHINDIIPPDEYADHVNDSVYTNYVAIQNLNFATEAAGILNQTVKPAWADTASKIILLFDEAKQYHPEYDGYNGQQIKQADIVLLGYPLGMNMNTTVRANDLNYYAQKTDSNGPAMTWGMHAVGYLELGNYSTAASNFNRSFANAQQPYLVWTETPTGGTTNFITGAGGFLQAVLFGYPGLRLSSDGLKLNPVLIEGSTSFKARNLNYMGSKFDVSYDSKQVTLRVNSVSSTASPLFVNDGTKDTPLSVGANVAFALPLKTPLLVHT